jgi:hypothetical protein
MVLMAVALGLRMPGKSVTPTPAEPSQLVSEMDLLQDLDVIEHIDGLEQIDDGMTLLVSDTFEYEDGL